MNICKYKNLSINRILNILEMQKNCKLGTANVDEIDIAPMWYTFDYDCKNKKFNFYFILMNEGTQMSNMRDTGLVCVFIDRYLGNSCERIYQSVVANGIAYKINDKREKAYILNKFKDKYFEEFMMCGCSKINFIKVEISEITGREYY